MIHCYEDAIENVVAHLKIEHDIDVVFDDDELGAYYHDAGIIGVNTNETLQEQLYVLLHEAGHAILKIEHKKYLETCDETLQGKLSLLREEMEAWKEGKALAEDMGIPINEGTWAMFCKQNLEDYIEWATS
jgi:Zn-dependent peptidase ImmA (M78 family)